ncbi:hypothetical protein AAG570_007675 [Ranatra chinensis]|uniref:Uncharacterized protein n=1 Tax=Ranatra chinensis TaxID=642074 RepID=A0ABD0XU91_9HEMI
MFHKNKTQETTEEVRIRTGNTFEALRCSLTDSALAVSARLFCYIPIPPASCVRYLGLYIDKRVTWNPHARLKRIDLNRKFGLLRNLLHRRSKLSSGNKLTIYNMILKPTSTYGIELWGSARKSNIDRIQSFQSKTLRTILDAP